MRVICVGDVMVDVLAQLPGPLAAGSDTPAPIALLSGGSAANTAAWCAAAGVPATFVGRVGDDVLGRKVLDELARAGVDLEVSVDPDLPTGTCIVLVDPDGERTMVPCAGANAVGGRVPALEPDVLLHVSGYALFHPRAAQAAAEAMRRARAAGCTVSVDAASAAPLRAYGPERFLDAIGSAVLFANADEAAVLSGTADAFSAARALGARCGAAVVKRGVGGAVWSDGRAVEVAVPEPVAVIDSTGAGDAFAAGVLAALGRGLPIAEALRAGNALAARAITLRGARP